MHQADGFGIRRGSRAESPPGCNACSPVSSQRRGLEEAAGHARATADAVTTLLVL